VRFIVLDATPHPCPYLPDRTAVLPLRWPSEGLTPAEFDRLLDEGDRRTGAFLYRTACPGCQACEPLRLPVERFSPRPSHRKVARKNRDVRVEVCAPEATPRHVEIYERHRIERGLGVDREEPLDVDRYRELFVRTVVPTVEVRYLVGDRLVAFSLLDLGAVSASSVYHCFDPDESRRSLGVFSVLAELHLARQLGLAWYYLGYWVGACRALAYKADWYPHQRRQGNVWREVPAPGAAPLACPPADD
jgi:arginine-tRNA-protein transferase